MYFEVLVPPPLGAEKNMALDEELLHSLQQFPRSLLRFYKWTTICATYGYFCDPFKGLNQQRIFEKNIQLARRPTGGGIIFHHCDLAFAVLVPSTHAAYSINPLDNYAFINHVLIEAIREFGISGELKLLQEEPEKNLSPYFCMTKPTKFDILLAGRKVGGGAQRRTKYGYLHQGSIALSLPAVDLLQEIFLPGVSPDAMLQISHPLLGQTCSNAQFNQAKQDLQSLLFKSFQKVSH
jgi:lipoate-protein ligase A